MNKIIATLCAAAVVATTFAAMPVSAAPMRYDFQNAEVLNVQFRDHDRRDDRRRHDRRDDRRHGDRFERRGHDYYFNGQRGFREHRRGYRQYQGYWFPPSAFVGAILNGIVR